ncbi:hypothetical protein [Thermogutta sp.]|uniref:hypothetical protein n=1 Tax=Thermogutta sp. TaxID=1962930 RepID=UPI0032208AAD
MDDEVRTALEEIAGDPELVRAILEYASIAEETAGDVSADVAQKSAGRFAAQLRTVADGIENRRLADRLTRLADDVKESEKSEWPEMAARVRAIAEKVSDEKLRAKLEAIAAKMEEESLGRYGYAYPEPQKAASNELEKRLAEVEKQYSGLAGLAEVVKSMQEELSALRATVNELRGAVSIPVPAVTSDRPVRLPPAAVLMEQIIRQR